jgi:hypothetical protein
MITHRQALEAIKVLGEYCDTHSCYVDCICADIESCPIRSLTEREMRIITKKTERLERKEHDNDR